MKKILITGANSYIGTSFENWLKQYKKDYEITTISLLDKEWPQKEFSTYGIVFHVAGIAHSDVNEIRKGEEKKYYQVNCNLTVDVAKKARREGVGLFIFMSSIIVYGDLKQVQTPKVITSNTEPNPSNTYGDSKLRAEKEILKLASDTFKVVVIRAPMIYGKNSKGNYSTLSKIALKSPFFPDFDNKRSMLYVDNLCEFVKKVCDYNLDGVLYPQNKEYVKTSTMVQCIAKAHNHPIYLIPKINFIVLLAACIPGKIGKLVKKAFGTVIYEKSLSEYPFDYQIKTLEESINITEKP